MNKYELALVVSAKIEDDARAAVVDKAKGYVERFGGKISDVEEWEKRKLAYEIQKQSEGYYFFIQFEAEPEAPAQIEENIRIMENVLRFLCVRKDEA
ncbi:MAG: 30S ribosomal protein S6 [Lachnospiraceae bacterium]|nr:30S ribosomal protein S6 [Lachnospiraceae bacterium]